MHIELGFVIITLICWLQIWKKQNWSHFNKYKAVKSSYKTNICYMISNVAKSFLSLILLNSIAIAFDVTLSSFSVMAFFWISVIFWFLPLGDLLKGKTQYSKKDFMLQFIRLKCTWISFLITISTFYVLKLK